MTTLDRIKGLVGDLARPFAIIASSASAAIATVVIAFKVDGFEGAALFIGAVYAGVGALYGAKSLEVAAVRKRDSEVEVAKVTARPPADDGELPPDQRIAP
jgi:hypothetical protein